MKIPAPIFSLVVKLCGGSQRWVVTHHLQIAPCSFLGQIISDIERKLTLAEPSYLGRCVLEQKDTICCPCKL